MRYTYTFTRQDGTRFEVTYGDNRIVKWCEWCSMRTEALLNTGLVIGDKLPKFDSFMQAVRFLKANADRLQ